MKSSLILVSLGGIFGSVIRYLIIILFNSSPTATIIINLSGCFLIGTASSLINPAYRLFLITGVLGSFTTFSAFGLEGFKFLKHGYTAEALLYIGIQVFFGIVMVYLGEITAN
ncbi:MAG TPA: fluoride efflux transporter CrcB [Gammaproteobacteria bacterium]|nr:fluoride efflux transporter CrcB [Gammaproteobacteria bacterium]